MVVWGNKRRLYSYIAMQSHGTLSFFHVLTTETLINSPIRTGLVLQDMLPSTLTTVLFVPFYSLSCIFVMFFLTFASFLICRLREKRKKLWSIWHWGVNPQSTHCMHWSFDNFFVKTNTANAETALRMTQGEPTLNEMLSLYPYCRQTNRESTVGCPLIKDTFANTHSLWISTRQSLSNYVHVFLKM